MCRNVPKTVEETNNSLVQFPSSSVWVSWNKTVLWILFEFLTRSIFSGENLDPLKSLSGIGASLFSAGQVTKAAIQYITGLMVNNSRTLIYKIENRAEIILICKSLLNKNKTLFYLVLSLIMFCITCIGTNTTPVAAIPTECTMYR